jgi:hypothetical protein
MERYRRDIEVQILCLQYVKGQRTRSLRCDGHYHAIHNEYPSLPCCL